MAWFCAATVAVPIAAAQQACPVVDGVVHADRCAPGWSPGDATAALGSAFGSGAHTVIVRKMASPWVLSSTVSLALGNQTVIFQAGVVVEARRMAPYWNESGNGAPRPLLRSAAAGSRNVTLRGPAPGAAGGSATLRMWKVDYLNSTLYPVHDEWRHVLWLAGAEDIHVADLTLSSSGGDGISMDWRCQRVHLLRLTLDDNYRNALTITAANDVLVESCVLSNTRGTAPSAGCDIEPDFPWSDLSNISFVDCSFQNNAGAGFQMAPGAIRPWNRTQWPGYSCAHEKASQPITGVGPACPLSVSLDRCVIDGGGCAVVEGRATAGCTHGEGPGPGRTWDGIGENYGIAVGGGHADGPSGSFVVSDSKVSNTALSGLMVSEKAATAYRVSFRSVQLVHTALNDTDCEIKSCSSLLPAFISAPSCDRND